MASPSVSVSVTSSPNYDNLFTAIYRKCDNKELAIFALRSYISMTSLDFQDKKLELMVRLFHRDKTFENTFIHTIKRNTETYTYVIIVLQKNKNSLYQFTAVFHIDDCWKKIKRIVSSIIDDYNCPICDTGEYSKLACPTCSKTICRNCILLQLEKRFHLRCPMCNICIPGFPEEFQTKLTQRMENSSPIIRRKIAEQFVQKVFNFNK